MENFELYDDDKRIADILVPGQPVDELPYVSLKMLKKYFTYLEEKLPINLELTGQETVGYFAWEEKFAFGYGTEKEHKQMKKEQASCDDTFKLVKLENADKNHGIIAKVSRITDKKLFDIPLADLEVCDQNSSEYILVSDYSMWFVNYGGE